MNATTNRHIRKTLGSMMMLIMMLISGSMNTWAQEKKEIYSTNFQNRDTADAYQDAESTKSKVTRATAFLRRRKQTEKKLHTNTCNVSDHAQRNRAWTDRA